MAETADVVIIGGGIQGISLAYHLAREGVQDVRLVEMNTLGSGSSGRSATVTVHGHTTECRLMLTQISFDAFMRFKDELGADCGYKRIGVLLLGNEHTALELRRNHGLLLGRGVESRLVDRNEIDGLTPDLNLDDIALGLYTPRDGIIDPHLIMMAYATAARRLGVRLIEGVRATNLEIIGDQIVGVCTTSGTIATHIVANAAGFRAREVAGWAGLNLPITNFKRHIFVTDPVAAYSDPFPFTYDLEVGWYMRREGPGLLIGMGAEENDEEDPQVDWAFLDQVVEHSIRRAPALADARVKTGWAGLRSLTPDDNPILGPAPHLKGYFNDCGWGGSGVMDSPAGGMVLADLILRGETALADVHPFRVDRFRNWRA